MRAAFCCYQTFLCDKNIRSVLDFGLWTLPRGKISTTRSLRARATALKNFLRGPHKNVMSFPHFSRLFSTWLVTFVVGTESELIHLTELIVSCRKFSTSVWEKEEKNESRGVLEGAKESTSKRVRLVTTKSQKEGVTLSRFAVISDILVRYKNSWRNQAKRNWMKWKLIV